MLDGIKKINSSKGELRKFGLTIGIALIILAGLFFWRGRGFNGVLLCISLVFLLLGCIFPLGLKQVYALWMMFGLIMGRIMTKVILTILFYLMIFPIGIVLKLLGKDILNLKIDKSIQSYWIKKDVTKDRECYEKQF